MTAKDLRIASLNVRVKPTIGEVTYRSCISDFHLNTQGGSFSLRCTASYLKDYTSLSGDFCVLLLNQK